MKLLTPKYLPSKPLGIALKRIIEFETLKIENAETIKLVEIIAVSKELIPTILGINDAATMIPKILGKYAICVACSSVIFEIKRGTKKNITSSTMV